jgi:hypothetical protein
MQKIMEIVEFEMKNQGFSQNLHKSISESFKFVEENSYIKLVKQLKEKIRYFDTPLEN